LRNPGAAVALHRLQHDRGDIAGREDSLKGFDIVEIEIAESARQRLVAFLVFRLGGGRDGGQGAAVERATESDDDAPLRRPSDRRGPASHQLDRRLVGFGAGVAQEYALRKTGCRDEFLGQSQRRLAVEHIAGMPQLVRLRSQRFDHFRILMAKRVHRDAGAEIHIVAALRVPHPRALAMVEHDLARPVHRQPVTLAEIDEILRG